MRKCLLSLVKHCVIRLATSAVVLPAATAFPVEAADRPTITANPHYTGARRAQPAPRPNPAEVFSAWRPVPTAAPHDAAPPAVEPKAAPPSPTVVRPTHVAAASPETVHRPPVRVLPGEPLAALGRAVRVATVGEAYPTTNAAEPSRFTPSADAVALSRDSVTTEVMTAAWVSDAAEPQRAVPLPVETRPAAAPLAATAAVGQPRLTVILATHLEPVVLSNNPLRADGAVEIVPVRGTPTSGNPLR